MKRRFLIIVAVISIYYTSCKKSASNNPIPVQVKPVTYLPVTAGTTFTYAHINNDTSKDFDTITVKFSGDTTSIGGKTYHIASYDFSNPKHASNTSEYYYSGNHIYSLRLGQESGTYALEFIFLNDTASVGYSSITPPNETGSFGGEPSRIVSKLLEKNLTKVVKGVTYTNVIHTQSQLQLSHDNGVTYTPEDTYDYYIVKNIGIIEEDYAPQNVITSSLKLIKSDIK